MWANLSSTNRSEHCYMPLRATARGVAEWYKAFSNKNTQTLSIIPCHCHPWKGEGNQNKDSIDFSFLMHLQNLWWVNHKMCSFAINFDIWYETVFHGRVSFHMDSLNPPGQRQLVKIHALANFLHKQSATRTKDPLGQWLCFHLSNSNMSNVWVVWVTVVDTPKHTCLRKRTSWVC